MNASSAVVPYEIDEFELAGLTARTVTSRGPHRAWRKRREFGVQGHGDRAAQGRHGAQTSSWIVFGEVVGVHIRHSLLKDGLFDTFGAGIHPAPRRRPFPAYAVTVTPESRFDIERPR